MQTDQGQRTGSTEFLNYECGITVKVRSQDYEFCRRIGLESFKGQVWHM